MCKGLADPTDRIGDLQGDAKPKWQALTSGNLEFSKTRSRAGKSINSMLWTIFVQDLHAI